MFCFVNSAMAAANKRERKGRGMGGKEKKNEEEEKKKKKRKIRNVERGGEREGRKQDSIGDTRLCIAANSLISILLPLLVSITPSGSLKEGGYQ